MKSPSIVFGTDGWRALIAREFTFSNVGLVAHAVAETSQEKAPMLTRMIVGYDRRFLSQRFAQTVAAVYVEHGYEVLFAQQYYPTPALSWAAKFETGVAGATVITASHNPPEWNGFKFKEPFGGSATPDTTKAFEARILKLQKKEVEPPDPEAFLRALKQGKIKEFNPMAKYAEALCRQVNVDAIRKVTNTVGLDVMYGSASSHFVTILRSLGVRVEELHGDENPGFHGTAPEPIAKNLGELCANVKNNHWACGLATDGDADRLGAVDEKGDYFTTQQILSVVYWHMLVNRKKKWNIARSGSTTRMVDLLAKRAGMKSFETPVGFKYIAEKMIQGEAQIGGEESGGIGIIDHIPERDGLLTGLLLLEILGTTGKGLRTIYEKICKEERPYYFTRYDIHLTPEQAQSVIERLKSNPPQAWDNRSVENLLTLDGFKFYLKDGGWVLIRPSGTEPIFRLYAEAESIEASEKLIEKAKAFVHQR